MTIVEKLDLADAYLKGDGQPKDEAKAAQLYFETALDGSAIGSRKYARCLRDGKGVEKNPSNAIEWYRVAVRRGDEISCYELGRLIYNTSDSLLGTTAEAEDLLLRSIEYGRSVAPSYFLLGRIELEGRYGRPVNAEKGIAYLEKSIELGNASAACYLGEVYYDGKVVEQDYDKAAAYLRIAAEADFPRALCDLGVCYQHGNGVEKDEKKALELFVRAEKLNYPAGTFNKIKLLLHAGDPQVRDERAAFELLSGFVESNRDPQGRCAVEIAWLYRDGCSLFAPDPAKAISYFEKAHSKGNSGGTVGLIKAYLAPCSDRQAAEKAYSLALGYKKQNWIDKAWSALLDYMDKSELSRAAAEQYREQRYALSYAAYIRLSELSDEALYPLGIMTLLGIGAPRDKAKAEEYLSTAAARGMKKAQNALAVLKREEDEKSSVGCPYCGSPMSASGVRFVCATCGSAHILPFINKGFALERFNRVNRLRQSGYYSQAERELDSMHVPDAEIAWYRALCRYGVRFLQGAALYRIERIQEQPFSKYCEYKCRGITELPEYKNLAADINDRCRLIVLETKEPAPPCDVVVAANPADARALDYARALCSQLSAQAPVQLITDYSVDPDAAEALRFLALQQSCVFVSVVGSKQYADCGLISDSLLRFQSNSLDERFRQTLTVALDGIPGAGGGNVMCGVPVTAAAEKIKQLLVPWYSTYRNIRLNADMLSSDVLREVNRTRSIIGQPLFSGEMPEGVSCVYTKLPYYGEFYKSHKERGVVRIYSDDDFRTCIEVKEAFPVKKDVNYNWKFYDMRGNLVIDYDSKVHIEKHEKNIHMVYQEWYVRLPENKRPVFKPGFYYVSCTIEGKAPAGTCFAVVDYLDIND